MSDSVRPPVLLPGQTPWRRPSWRVWLLGTLPGRAVLLGAAIKAVTWTLEAAGITLPGVVDAIDMVGSLALLFGVGYGGARLAIWAKRRLLWRVRRKLILSYVFVGVVPVCLVIVFFLLAGLLLFFNVSSYLVKSRIRALTDQSVFLAQTAVLELQRSLTPDAVRETLERRQASADTRYPFVSLAVVPVSGLTCKVAPALAAPVPRTLPVPLPVTSGPWGHLDAPPGLPPWATCTGFGGLVAYRVPAAPGVASDDDGHTRLVMRAIAMPDMVTPTWAVVLDLPLTAVVEARIREETGIQIGEVASMPFGARGILPVPGRELEHDATGQVGSDRGWAPTTQRWVAFLDFTDWASGQSAATTVGMRINVWDIYERLSVASTSLPEMNFGQYLLAVLALVGALFLIIQCVALVIGLVLALQITGAVHDLFTGTQHLRNRDFTHQIPVRARDQLGELAESFNLMTGEVATLLGEVAEKGRIEQEMLAAREIQQRLLPSGPLHFTGLEVSAFCEPAREVAGDYYDFLPITDTMLGVIIADVAGKGLAAGLYMAQLKVIVQSLARMHHEPRQFLLAVNGVVSANLDAKSFITMTYAVVDLERREMTFARAGHCPLIYVSNALPGTVRKAQLLAPDGLVVGLQIDDGQLFESLLQEQTVPLNPGDLIVFFTDGISETMNEAFECFGESRLARVVEQYAHLPFDQLRSYILAELRSFAGDADQHDDMTMILLKVGELL